MGRPKSQKKQWRNLDDSEVVKQLEQQSHQERHGPAVESLKDDQLFFVDKSADHEAPQVAKRAKKREMRPTRAQLILSAPQQVKPVIQPARAPPTKKRKDAPQQQLQPVQEKPTAKKGKQQQQQQQQQQQHQELLDLWAEENGSAHESEQPSTSAPSKKQKRATRQEQQEEQQQQPPKLYTARGPSARRKGKHAPTHPPIKAVEIDPAGCSYNPEEESHQDALAAAAAAENKKLLKKELGPAPIPLMSAAELQNHDELEQLQTYADVDEDDNEIKLADGDDSSKVAEVKAKLAQKADKKNTKDRNREARRIAQEQATEMKRALKKQRAQLDHLNALQQQLKVEEEEGKKRQLRKQVVQAEKALSQPPKLSRHRFEDVPTQVLTSDEVGSGLRRLRGYPMLALERFKSIQKRGLIEPRKRTGPKGPKRMVEYEKQAHRERAIEGQAQLAEMQKANRQKKAGK